MLLLLEVVYVGAKRFRIIFSFPRAFSARSAAATRADLGRRSRGLHRKELVDCCPWRRDSIPTS